MKENSVVLKSNALIKKDAVVQDLAVTGKMVRKKQKIDVRAQ